MRRKRFLKRKEEDEEKKLLKKKEKSQKEVEKRLNLLDDEEIFNYDVRTIVKEKDENFKEIYARKFYRNSKDGNSKSIRLLQN